MLAWRIALVAAVCSVISLGVPPAKAGNDELPEPDYEAVEAVARRVERDVPYVMSLPKRKRECLELADPYYDGKTTASALTHSADSQSARLVRVWAHGPDSMCCCERFGSASVGSDH